MDGIQQPLYRRDFLKLGILAAAAIGCQRFPWQAWEALSNLQSEGGQLGRLCLRSHLRAAPSAESRLIETLEKDTVVVWLREVLGKSPPYTLSRTWVETPSGYLFAADVQPVLNQPNRPVKVLPEIAELGRGMWAEVSVPFTPITLIHSPSSHWIKASEPEPRLYYSQIFWIDDVKQEEDAQVFYRVREKYGRDMFWAAAEAFRPLEADELAPISPDAEDKKVLVDLNHQVMTCYEAKDEVYFCRISSGTRFDPDENGKVKWATPLGPHPIWRKLISHHMSGGDVETGYDLPGIAWTTLFSGDGVAIHGTYWHNDYGTPLSHGCINARPEDAKWVFRWTQPYVSYEVGDIIVEMPGGTIVDVVAG